MILLRAMSDSCNKAVRCQCTGSGQRIPAGEARNARLGLGDSSEYGCVAGLTVMVLWRRRNLHPPPGGSGTGSFLLHYILHEPGRFQGTQVDTSRLDGCQQTLDVERLRPQTTRRQSVTETRSNGFDSLFYRLDRLLLCIQHCQDVNVRPCPVVGPPLSSNVIHGEADSDRRKL